MNDLIEKQQSKIENLIYEIRGKQVMLDSDLAKLYGVETKRINEAVRNNKDKFPERFSFFITNDEKYAFEVEKFDLKGKQGGRRYLPRVFTEQGIAMLSTILKSRTAIQVSIQIMDAFVLMKKYISNELIEQKYINNQVLKNTNDIRLLQESFGKLENEKINEIYFEGQIYDAYSKIIDIIKQSNKELIIIDNYADNSVLDMISKINTNIILITKESNLLKKIDIEKYNKQYHNLDIIYDNTFHDRYIIIDKNKIYHCGTSLNHIVIINNSLNF